MAALGNPSSNTADITYTFMFRYGDDYYEAGSITLSPGEYKVFRLTDVNGQPIGNDGSLHLKAESTAGTFSTAGQIWAIP